MGILNELRRSVAREQARRADLPADLDAQIFGYLDLLEGQREAANRAAKAAAKEVAAKEAPAKEAPAKEAPAADKPAADKLPAEPTKIGTSPKPA